MKIFLTMIFKQIFFILFYRHLSELVTSWGFLLPVRLETLDSVAVPNPVRSKAKTSSPLREANRAVLCSSLSLKMPSAPDKTASTCSIHVNLLSSKLSSRCFQNSYWDFQGQLAAVTSRSWRRFTTKSIVDWLHNSEADWKLYFEAGWETCHLSVARLDDLPDPSKGSGF